MRCDVRETGMNAGSPMLRTLVAALVASMVLSGCASTASTALSTGSVDVAVRLAQPARGPQLHVLRIEDANGTAVAEQAFPRLPAELRRDLPGGSYRIVSYQRDCSGTCPDVSVAPTTPVKGLAPPNSICGSPFRLDAGQTYTAVVSLIPGTGCEGKPSG